MSYKFFLFILLIIAALSVATLWRLPDLSKLQSLQDILPKEFQEMPSLVPGEENEFRKFVSSDGKFEAEYPASWAVINEGGLLGALAPDEWIKTYDLQALFLAQNFWGGEFVQMVVYKGVFEIPVEEIFEKMRETNESSGWTVEVLELKTETNGGIFEVKYENQAGILSHSKEKMLISKNEGYLISLFALEKDWPELEETIDKILNSAIML